MLGRFGTAFSAGRRAIAVIDPASDVTLANSTTSTLITSTSTPCTMTTPATSTMQHQQQQPQTQPQDQNQGPAHHHLSSEDYRVRLDAFEGPMDLLLFLIRRAEVDIHDIPISTITGQYLDYLMHLDGGVESVDVDTAGEFLVMAATLMEIKSRMLTPPSPQAATDTQDPDAPEGEVGRSGKHTRGSAQSEFLDPRAELVRQLLEYKRFRDVGDRLDERRQSWSSRYPAGHAAADREAIAEAVERTHELELDEVSPFDLVEAFSRILESVDFTRLGEHRVEIDETPIELHAADIVDRLERRWKQLLVEANLDPDSLPPDATDRVPKASATITFASIFEGRSRSELIGLFLAMLELVRQRKVIVRQSTEDLTATGIEVGLGDEEETTNGT